MAKLGCGARFQRFWREGHRQARIDIQQRWLRAAAFLWFLGLGASFGILYPFSYVGVLSGNACLPDGRFGVDPTKYKYVSSSPRPLQDQKA